ncbi:MAG: ABC transporter ATP-binding protein [Firmicutes bacterium]|nr:ABC transporter ATP-binding protein [Bacillota bacterium]
MLLAVNDLRTSFFTYAGEVKAVDGVSFSLDEGEAVALVGESGCGKSVTALSIMGLINPPGKILSGSIVFNGRDLIRLSERELRHIRGNEIGMIFQDPMTSLNPVLSIGTQIIEVRRLHQGLRGRVARQRAVELLSMVGIPSPGERLRQYPHQFSGGMRQRVMIAMALACQPKLLIADEPTTALDVTIQAQIIELMKELQAQLGMAIILITHDLGVVAGLAKKVYVMYAGRIVESGSVDRIYYHARHPYTWGLLASVPRLDDKPKKRLVPIQGQPPDLLAPPPGCAFASRCRYAMRICVQENPALLPSSDDAEHRVACWREDPEAAAFIGASRGGVA